MKFIKIPSIIILTLCSVLSGCATVNYMAIDKTSTTVDVSSKSVLLMTLDFSRSDKSGYFTPNYFFAHFEKPNAQSKDDRQNFEVKDDDKIITSGGRTIYVLRMALEPGEYQLKGITGFAMAFPFHGTYFVPLFIDINVPKHAVAYIGRVKTELRPRQENEFRAGPVIPLIDQAVMGISTGTFDIAITDMSQEDLAIFRSTFPALSSIPIKTAILPAFDRPKVQRWWEGENANTKEQPPLPNVAVPSGDGAAKSR
ncbi:MAG: hypothetical protein ABIG43_01480 [Chloroflexota bacterium]